MLAQPQFGLQRQLQAQSAINFNAFATEDDGSCLFPALGMDCDGNSLGGDMCLGDLNESVFGEACD